MTIYNVLNLGAGWQSSRILLGMCRGELPKPDVAIFADTQWEPAAVYQNLEFLKAEAAKVGIPVVTVTRGNLRQDNIDFRQWQGKENKRYASIPAFVTKPNGEAGIIRRQCTSEYKIIPVAEYIRRELLGLKRGQRIPKGVIVRQWFGISDDEASRCVFPGQWKGKTFEHPDLFGGTYTVTMRERWMPEKWRENVYPLLGEVWLPDRKIREEKILPRREQRADCGAWLKANYPGRTFPRSACLGCPFRTNEEWREMRDQRPKEWEDACEFDDLQRRADAAGQERKGLSVGLPYLHRQMVPLRMADLDGVGERKGGGCGTLFDGQDGMCDL